MFTRSQNNLSKELSSVISLVESAGELNNVRHITVSAGEIEVLRANNALASSSANKKALLANSLGKKSRMLSNADAADFGSKISIDTLTAIKQRVIEQKFYTLGQGLTPSSFVPVNSEFGAWMDQLVIYKSFQLMGEFEDGFVGNNAAGRLASVNVGYNPLFIPTEVWANDMNYNIIQLQKMQANQGQAINLITSLETARKKRWDLGIQEVFLSDKSTDNKFLSLINQDQAANPVTINTTTITKSISSMTDAEFQAFISAVIADAYTNSDSTQFPNRFVIPTSDYLGLAAAASATFPNISKLEYMVNGFKALVGSDFQVLPLVYLQANQNSIGGSGTNRYVMYNYSPDTLEAHIPVPYTSTSIDTSNNFQFQNVAYGQFSGVQVYRPKEMLYFDYT